jgi:hypothetical protein
MMEIRGPRSIAPLAVLRIAFGAIMLISTLRFIAKGWVYEFYIAPKIFFPFYGFEWVRPLPGALMYLVFGFMAASAFFILIGYFYRISITAFFTLFVYVELLDKTYYLNHYYFVSVIAFLLLLAPAHRYFSMDVLRKPALKVNLVPAWMIGMFRAQLVLVYFLAGLSKLNHDWLAGAMPLKIWLPANGDLPLIGGLLRQEWVAYAFSWFGAAFDLSIGFFLLYGPTRKLAYIFVLIFHVLTGWLFKIGMFPYIMIFVTVVFFSEGWHLRAIAFLRGLGRERSGGDVKEVASEKSGIGKKWLTCGTLPGRSRDAIPLRLSPVRRSVLLGLLAVFAFIQLLLPFRYLLYPGKLFWTEQGYRFSWRVMLMEKGGTAFFYVRDPVTGKRGEVNNAQFLTPLQERMMDTQPDMILQYAHFLAREYSKRGVKDPIVTVESYVTLNGSGSRLFIDSTVDLARERENFLPKKWILPFREP